MRKLLAVALLVALSAFTCHNEQPTGYTWYPVSSVDLLREQLIATNPAVLTVKLGQGDTVWLQVVPQMGAGARLMADSNPPVNDSHRCPPDCP